MASFSYIIGGIVLKWLWLPILRATTNISILLHRHDPPFDVLFSTRNSKILCGRRIAHSGKSTFSSYQSCKSYFAPLFAPSTLCSYVRRMPMRWYVLRRYSSLSSRHCGWPLSALSFRLRLSALRYPLAIMLRPRSVILFLSYFVRYAFFKSFCTRRAAK